MTSAERSALKIPFSVALLSGKGGVGKTTLSLNLARRLSQERLVWLVDLDLFNRGTTSALWESETSIPLSMAELVRDAVALRAKVPLGGTDGTVVEEVASLLKEKLKARSADLSYTEKLYTLPAARAQEGREASYLLWHGMEGVSAEEFLWALLTAFGEIAPDCIVVMDGHGGLDDLSIGAALVSDITYIVNEPDLITFTGSITLYQEIARASEERGIEPRIEFIVNRVPPGKTVHEMDRDFGDALRTISPAREAVAAYFPLEPELFGVFGDDPFVSEIFTRFLFSQKVRLLARRLVSFGLEMGRLPHKGAEPDRRTRQKQEASDAALRIKLRREVYKRGDRLLILWLSYLVAAMGSSLWTTLGSVLNDSAPSSFLFYLFLVLAAIWLVVQTGRWVSVQRSHIKNSRRIRALRGRRRRLGESDSANLRADFEEVAEKRYVWMGLRIAAVALFFVAVVSALLIPNFLDALQKARQKRTVADIRNVGTAMFAWLTDQVGAASAGQSQTPLEMRLEAIAMGNYSVITIDNLREKLVPVYLTSVPDLDGWSHPYEYRLNSDVLGKQVLGIRSPGRDGTWQGDSYTISSFDPTDYDQDLVWVDGFFVRWPQRNP